MPKGPASSTVGCRGSGAGSFNLPLKTGARVQHPGRRRHQLVTKATASLTCGRRGSGASAFQLALNTQARVAAPRPPASLTYATWPVTSYGTAADITNLCHRAWHAQLVVVGGLVPAPFNLTLNTGARVRHPGRRRHQLMPQGRVSLTCGCRGSGAGALWLALKHGGHGAAARPPASLTYASFRGQLVVRSSRIHT